MTDVKAWVNFENIDDFSGKFTVSPLLPGMGTTIGNSLRRVLLSSLQGTAVTSINIEGVEHEFCTLPNAVEDVLDVICNIKSIVFRLHSDDPVTLSIKHNGKGSVTAKDIKHDSDVEIITPDQHIAEFTKSGKLNMTLTVSKGVGYVPSDALVDPDAPVNTINLDAPFSPILKVNTTVEKVRVGKSLDYDSVVLDVLTDGSINVESAVKKASEKLVELFMLFADMNKPPEVVSSEEEDPIQSKQEYGLMLTIDDLELSARSMNCLKKAGIETVSELVNKDMSELIQIKNFGKKSADEINDKLSQYGLALKEAVKEEL